jgi:hypothetical protein
LAGLLTFPSLLYLPGSSPVALYKQTSIMGITAAGTVPDSHRIPLHRGNICRLIAFRMQRYIFFEKICINIDFFSIFGYNEIWACLFANNINGTKTVQTEWKVKTESFFPEVQPVFE